MISSIPRASAPAAMPVADDWLHRCLALYRPDGIQIQQAYYVDRTLHAAFRLYPLNFHKRPLSHLSRVQIVHYIGQAAFVLAGCMVREGLLTPLTEQDYVLRIEEESCTFRRLTLRFRQYLPNADGTRITMRCAVPRRLRAAWLLPLEFELNSGACQGEAQAVILAGEVARSSEGQV